MNKRVISILALTTIICAGLAVFFYFKAFPLQQKSQAAPEDELQSVLAKVSRLVVLPTNETPTLATVADVEKLRNQPFFANAKDGDKLLVYTAARKAILYDPVADKIVEIAPLNLSQPAETPPPLKPASK